MTCVSNELRRLGITPSRRFSQCFLIDRQVRDELIDLASLTAEDTVLEIGPGLGFLTSSLIERAGRVIAVEKDRTLAPYLRNRFPDRKNLEIVQEDILRIAIPKKSKIVSSPPYNISSKLTLKILDSPFRLAAMLMQREFVRRLTASAGSAEYGRLTVMVQYRADATFVREVPRSAFYPKPRVESALVTITPAKEPLLKDRIFFETMVRELFTQRRRKLTRVLANYLERCHPTKADLILQAITVPVKRVYETTPREFVELSNQIITRLREEGLGT